jgi:uncharacterized protein
METVMTPATMALRPILFCLLLALSGCFGLSRGGPAQEHYVLGTGGQAERPALGQQPAAAPAMIGLRPPRLAEYLASPFIVVRRGTHRVEFSESHRWGEVLARGINRTLAAHLGTRSPAHRVEAAPWSPGAQPEYLIQVHVLRFEGVAPEASMSRAGEAHLLATWEILRSRDGSVLVSGTTEVRSSGWTVGDFARLVGLLDDGLATLAEDLVLGLEQVLPPADGSDSP